VCAGKGNWSHGNKIDQCGLHQALVAIASD
jgi:hypothetical protein